jgi:phage-related protein
MEAMRSIWAHSRLDDLNGRVGGISDEMKELRKDVRELRGEFGALQRTMLQVGGGLIGTLVVGMLGLIATQL